jgi:hypothetical protein
MGMFVQNETNIMELYASRRFKLSNSYNVKHGYNNIFIYPYLLGHLDNYHIQTFQD